MLSAVLFVVVSYLYGFLDVVAYNDEFGMQLTEAYETRTSCNQGQLILLQIF